MSDEQITAYLPRFAAARLVSWWRKRDRRGALAIGYVLHGLIGGRALSPKLAARCEVERVRLVEAMCGGEV